MGVGGCLMHLAPSPSGFGTAWHDSSCALYACECVCEQSSDAFTGFGRHDAHTHNREVRTAQKMLTEEVRSAEGHVAVVGGGVPHYILIFCFAPLSLAGQIIPAFGQDLQRRVVVVTHAVQLRDLCHERGVNMRNLRLVRASIRDKRLRALLLTDMIARCSKVALRNMLRVNVPHSVGATTRFVLVACSMWHTAHSTQSCWLFACPFVRCVLWLFWLCVPSCLCGARSSIQATVAFFNTVFGSSRGSTFWHRVVAQLSLNDKFGDVFSLRKLELLCSEIGRLENVQVRTREQTKRLHALRLKYHQFSKTIVAARKDDVLAAVDLRPFCVKVRVVNTHRSGAASTSC